MIKINLNLRDTRSVVETPIHLICRWNNIKVVFNTKFLVKPEIWNFDIQRIKTSRNIPNNQNNLKINNHLDKIITRINELYLNFEFQNQRFPTKNEFSKLLKSEFSNSTTTNQKRDFLTFFDVFIKGLQTTLSGKPYSPNTIKTYKQCYNSISDYCKSKNKTK